MTGLAALECTSTGYTAKGIALAGRNVTINDSTDTPANRARYDANDVVASAFTSAGAVNTVTDLLIAYENATATFANYVPIARIKLVQTYAPQGADFTVQWHADGIFTLS